MSMLHHYNNRLKNQNNIRITVIICHVFMRTTDMFYIIFSDAVKAFRYFTSMMNIMITMTMILLTEL